MRRRVLPLLLLLSLSLSAFAADPDLVGLWRATKVFGPELHGPLTIIRDGNSWRAEIAGRSTVIRVEGERLSFELPDGTGGFRGRVKGNRIAGHWIQARTATSGSRYALPITLDPLRPGRWRGTVTPLEDSLTFFIPVTRAEDGTLRAFLRNPDRNLGKWLNFERLVLDGTRLRAVRSDGQEVMSGTWDAEADSFSLYTQARGGHYDFQRATPADEALFYARGKSPSRYAYQPPPAESDGWRVGTLRDARMSAEAMQSIVQSLIDRPIDSRAAPDIHAILVARNGALVFEEYFHGFHRDALHETRSAAKSITGVLVGAAKQNGVAIDASTPVYATMRGASSDLDPRKRAMKLGDLMMMASGLACDDDDPESPGQEEKMYEKADADWYEHILDLPAARQPGEKAAYCTGGVNLAGGVLAKVSGRWLPELFQDYVAEPLQIRHYAMNLMPTGNAFMGGGVRFLPRDFMKLGQMLMDHGRWNGKQVVPAAWAERSISPLIALRKDQYGYTWWVHQFPYRGGTVQAFSANGNGGQVVVGVPELGLVIAFWGGNYNDPAGYLWKQELVPAILATAER
jgi:CubicO group peptidase (beta-lactamase class C family)